MTRKTYWLSCVCHIAKLVSALTAITPIVHHFGKHRYRLLNQPRGRFSQRCGAQSIARRFECFDNNFKTFWPGVKARVVSLTHLLFWPMLRADARTDGLNDVGGMHRAIGHTMVA